MQLSPMYRVILICAAIVVVFDVAASLLLQRLDASLLWMFAGEALIYAAAGFAGGRLGGFRAGAGCGAAVAALDCLIGWPITWAIGTGQVSGLTLVAVTFVLMVMITAGLVAGMAGATVARIAGRR
jgi:hypothetical protein